MKLRRFNNLGLESAQRLLDDLEAGVDRDIDLVLFDDDLTQVPAEDVVIEPLSFGTRFELGKYLYDTLLPAAAVLPDIDRDVGLWAWLAIAWLDILAPSDSNGFRKLRDRARWIPVFDDYRKHYRHLLAGPYRIYHAHSDNPYRAMAVLATNPASPGEVAEQVVSRQEVITNPVMMQVLTELYYDNKSQKLKRGSGRKGPGGPRRLKNVLEQFELTWDFYSMDSTRIKDLLPSEFRAFLQ